MRLLDFSDGFESASAPSGLVGATVTGSWASPELIVAAAGITPTGVAEEVIFIEGSGGPVDISANPQIAVGTQDGQRLVLICTDDTNTVKLEDGTGLGLNGEMTMRAESVLQLIWVDTLNKWIEFGRVER